MQARAAPPNGLPLSPRALAIAAQAHDPCCIPSVTTTIPEAPAAREPFRPILHQRWSDLLFLHWRVEPDSIAERLPPGLEPQRFDGSAWIGIVPFAMSGIRPPGLPAVPGLSAFPELNLRTYVIDAQGRTGVWFFSLDAGGWLGVQIARRCFHLPYHHATMGATRGADGWVTFSCRRRSQPEGALLNYRYRGLNAAFRAQPDSLEAFLCERYRLFSWDARRKRLYTGRVAHTPYPLQQAEVAQLDPGLFAWNGLPVPGRAPDHSVYSPGVAVAVARLKRVRPRGIS